MTDTTKISLTPFHRIGLSFSGGGYRAAAFSLGVLDYLQRVKMADKTLLDRVFSLSTVSGGTITGAFFSFCKAQGMSHAEFYRALYDFLEADKLVSTAISKFVDAALWKTTSKKKTLINAFALAYKELLVDAPFGELYKLDEATHHLKYACFNATEFTYGLTYRFQNKEKFGNYYLPTTGMRAFKDQIPLSDVIAASSCFPTGFAPMIFPDDFCEDHNTTSFKRIKLLPEYTEGIGIMDGGIVDNQGIGSLINIDNSKGNQMDLLIVNDVGAQYMSPWKQDEPINPSAKGQSIQQLFLSIAQGLRPRKSFWATAIGGLLLMAVAAVLEVFYHISWITLSAVGGVLFGVGMVLLLAGFALTMVKKKVLLKVEKALKSATPASLWKDIQLLEKIEIPVAKRMLVERGTSTISMVTDIFLRQLRRINMKFFFADPALENRRIVSNVYQLNGMDDSMRKAAEKQSTGAGAKVSKRIEEVALIASEMPTTLWWDAEDRKVNRLDHLIACGQFTTCYNLLDYIEKLPQDLLTADILQLQIELKKDWKAFSQQPLCMTKVFEGKRG